jgi:hypothetical protein
MLVQRIYYPIKPLLPRSLQIILRRSVVLRKRKSCANIWPIDEGAAKISEGWSGWPDGKKFALVLTHDVEAVEGQKKCYQLAELEMRLGFRSSFNFVAEGYRVDTELRYYLTSNGFEIGLHGLTHDGNLFKSRRKFLSRVPKINQYLKEWDAVGFRAPSMYHNLEWIGELGIEYDASTFDTDPFEPQPDGVRTIFPFWVAVEGRAATASAISSLSKSNSVVLQPPSPSFQPPTVSRMGFVELPYTLPQDHTIFVLMGEKDISIWKKKLDWIAKWGGMSMLNVHPDYINFGREKTKIGEYPVRYYEEFLHYVKDAYRGQYWHVLPRNIARFWRNLQNEKG